MPSEQDIRSQVNASFRFVVEIDGERQGAFTECTLPVVEWDMEEIKEGGLNTYTHQLPGMRKKSKVVLKNGVAKGALVDWYLRTMSEEFTRKPITITLLDLQQNPVLVWEIAEAYPIKWTGPQLKTDANTIAIQTLEFACGEVTIA